MLVRVAKHLYRVFADHPQTTDDFVVYIDDQGGDIDLIKRCVPTKWFRKHFEKYAKPSREDQGISAKDRLVRYLEEPWLYEKEILAFGKEAVGPLIKKLDDPKDGGAAAWLLGDLNVSTEPVINALRRFTTSYTGMATFCSRALFVLGDVEFLFSLVDDAKTRRHAVWGILRGLGSQASRHANPVPLDYRHVERLLAKKSTSITRRVNDQLKPGSSFISIRANDVDEALRGLESRHTVIRQHAACVLGERGLGNAVGKRILPILAERLKDPVPNVRRLTLLALSYWKSAAAPYRAQMQQLTKDKDADVRRCARYVLRELLPAGRGAK